jgi:hypothetical protein
MTEIVVALLMIVAGEIKEHRIQESMSKCLKGKRIAMRSASSNVEYHCLKAKVETEIYMGEKSIKKIIIE